MLRRFAFILFLLSVCGPVMAQVALRPAPTVGGPQIRLGDLFTGLDADIAARPVAPAPAPGEQHMLDAARLTAIAASNALSWRPANPGLVVMVTRSGSDVPPERIIAALAAALVRQGAVGDGEVSLDRPDLRIVVPKGSPTTVDVADLSYDPRTAKFTAMVRAPAGSGETTRLTGQFSPMVDVPVPARPIAAGDILRDSDLTLTRLRADRAVTQAVTDPAKLVGKTAKRALPVGAPVRPTDLVSTILVSKNNIVNVQVGSGSLNLVMQGKALDDGAEGDTVRVLNIRSNKTVQGIVTAAGTVSVLLGTATVGNN